VEPEGVKLAGVEEAEEGGGRHGRKTPRSEAVDGRKMLRMKQGSYTPTIVRRVAR
jgi:hypothetical protein